eukprot:jgi/Ulvmu1/3659/UM017_0073.1
MGWIQESRWAPLTGALIAVSHVARVAGGYYSGVRWSALMGTGRMKRGHFQKGAQWHSLTRMHAELVVADRHSGRSSSASASCSAGGWGGGGDRGLGWRFPGAAAEAVQVRARKSIQRQKAKQDAQRQAQKQAAQMQDWAMLHWQTMHCPLLGQRVSSQAASEVAALAWRCGGLGFSWQCLYQASKPEQSPG